MYISAFGILKLNFTGTVSFQIQSVRYSFACLCAFCPTEGGKGREERKEKHPQPTVGGAQIAAKAWGIAKHPLWTDCSASTITSPDACSKSGSAAQKPSGAMKYGLTLAFGAIKDRSG